MLRIQCDACGKLLYPDTRFHPPSELPYAYLVPYYHRWKAYGLADNLGAEDLDTQHVCSEQCLKTMLEIVGVGRK